MENLIAAFVVIAAVAIVLQMAILAGIYFQSKRTAARMEKLADRIEEHAVPAFAAARKLLEESGPKIVTTIQNAAETSTMLRNQAQRLDATVTDVVDRTRLQVIRTDELVTRTLDRVEETTDMVHTSVIVPVKQIAGLLQGLTAGAGSLLGFLLGRRRRNGGPEDEMFI